MFSKTIYHSDRVLPYVYKCINKVTGDFYIGYREANKIPSTADLPKYKTSSKLIKPNFGDYDWYIICEFFNGKDAYEFEQSLILETISDTKSLNRGISGKYVKVVHSEYTKNLISNAHKGRTASIDSRRKMSETRQLTREENSWNQIKDKYTQYSAYDDIVNDVILSYNNGTQSIHGVSTLLNISYTVVETIFRNKSLTNNANVKFTKLCAKHGKRWDSYEHYCGLVIQLHNEGKSPHQIANIMRVSWCSIITVLKAHNISPNKSKPGPKPLIRL